MRAGREIRRWNRNPAAIVAAGARQHPRLTAIVDDDETVSSAELERRTNALARRLLAGSIGPDRTVGILSHNRALAIEALMAVSAVGANAVLLNTGFSPTQVREVVAREEVDLLIADGPLAAALSNGDVGPLLGAADVEEALRSDGEPVPPPPSVGRIVVLTSGTTGSPRGARRSGAAAPLDAAGILSCIPFQAGETTVVAAPLFHGLGLFNANLALALGSTVVLRERFDPEAVLADVQRHWAVVLVAVPVMLQRIMALPRHRRDGYDCSSLRIVVCGGAPLSGELATAFMNRFGDVLYNVYGSTETALAAIASPAELRRAPGTAGHPAPGVSVRIVDDDGRRVRPGATGRIFVGSHLRFEGYTGGGAKATLGSLLSTGDLGRFDRWGRLFIEGREDEMIVSGGENVYPVEVEESLAAHPAVLEAAVLGVPDEEFGQRLVAHVVRHPGVPVSEDALKRHVRTGWRASRCLGRSTSPAPCRATPPARSSSASSSLRSGRRPPPPPTSPRRRRESQDEPQDRPPRRAPVAPGTAHGEEAQAYMSITPAQGWSSHVGDLRLVVGHAHRGEGVGRLLARHGLLEGVAMGLRKFTVAVAADKAGDIEMFTSIGFRAEALLEDHIRDREGALHDLVLLSHDVSQVREEMATLGIDAEVGLDG